MASARSQQAQRRSTSEMTQAVPASSVPSMSVARNASRPVRRHWLECQHPGRRRGCEQPGHAGQYRRKRGIAPPSLPLAIGLSNNYAVLLADGVSTLTSSAGATLCAVNGATRSTLVTYGSLPTAPDGVAYGITLDPYQYGQSGLFAYNDPGSGNLDLYYFKSDGAGLIRATNFVTAAAAQTPRAQAWAVRMQMDAGAAAQRTGSRAFVP